MLKYFRLQLWLVVVCAGICVLSESGDAANAGTTNELRSAYLGTSVWNEGLSSREVNDQLKAHFAEVLVQLKTKGASSLLTALTRAEASSEKRWSDDERRAALIHLAHNRQQQIKRLRDYMNRGRFPLNEGHSPNAVPVFVDRHETHCAVAHLMHSDGKDTEVAQIVNANNLVRILSVQGGSMAQWIRSSGLTQEEAAMIQPAYPVFGITSFDALTGVFPELADGNSGLTLSDLSVRRTSFSAALPASFQTTPNAIDAIFEQGKAELDNSSDLTQNFLSNSGVLFGANGTGSDGFVGGPGGTPTNLDDWLYFGPNDAVFGGLVFGSSGPNNVGIIEIEYQIRSQDGEAFSDVGFSSANEFNGFDFPNQVNNTSEQNALLLLSEIYQGDSNELLGEHEFFVAGSVTNPSLNSPLFGTGLTSVSEDFLRIKTYGLAVGDASIDRVFNEFTAVQVPEPSSGIAALLFGAIVIRRRNRRLIAN